jgi:uncharacterized membrane protein YdbT with pleckstrin-like domain
LTLETSEDSYDDVVFDVRPHWWTLARPVLMLFVTAAGCGFLAAVAPHDDPARAWVQPAVLIVGLLVAVKTSVVPWLGWLTTRYVVTDRQLVVRSGVLTPRERALSHVRLESVDWAHGSFAERMLGCGTLTAVPVGGVEAWRLAGVPEVAKVRAEVVALGGLDAPVSHD